jgi:hypothetical protein
MASSNCFRHLNFLWKPVRALGPSCGRRLLCEAKFWTDLPPCFAASNAVIRPIGADSAEKTAVAVGQRTAASAIEELQAGVL